MDIYKQNIYQLFGPKSQDFWHFSPHMLPGSYPDDVLIIMPVEPGKTYIYWDFWAFPPGEHEYASDVFESFPGPRRQVASVIVRIYAFGLTESRTEASFIDDHPVDFQSRSIFLDLDWQKYRYQAELGVLDQHGDFVAIVLSNIIGPEKTECFGPPAIKGENKVPKFSSPESKSGLFVLSCKAQEALPYDVGIFKISSMENPARSFLPPEKLASGSNDKFFDEGKKSISPLTAECERMFAEGISSFIYPEPTDI